MIIWAALTVIFLLILQDLVCWFLLQFNFKNFHGDLSVSDLPKVSVLVPARNEEEVIPDCLTALEELVYPGEKIEFLVADDDSSDQTGALLSDWAGKGTNRRKVEIPAPDLHTQHLNGKARVLSEMIKYANGQLYLFTDADCRVNRLWAMEMVSAFRPKMGMVTGITKVDANQDSPFWNVAQGLDWWLTLGLVKVTSDLGSHLTAVGNNMLVSAEAYQKAGGFEHLPFSVTEDFELGKAIAAEGYMPVHLVSSKSLIATKAEKSWKDLLEQRKRWMRGAMGLPFYWKALLFCQVVFFPALVMLAFKSVGTGMLLWGIKILVQGLFIQSFAKKTGTVLPWFSLLFFEVYYAVISWSTIVYYFWPSKIHWKERKY